jgi:hypothetical protein
MSRMQVQPQCPALSVKMRPSRVQSTQRPSHPLHPFSHVGVSFKAPQLTQPCDIATTYYSHPHTQHTFVLRELRHSSALSAWQRENIITRLPCARHVRPDLLGYAHFLRGVTLPLAAAADASGAIGSSRSDILNLRSTSLTALSFFCCTANKL